MDCIIETDGEEQVERGGADERKDGHTRSDVQEGLEGVARVVYNQDDQEPQVEHAAEGLQAFRDGRSYARAAVYKDGRRDQVGGGDGDERDVSHTHREGRGGGDEVGHTQVQVRDDQGREF